MGKTQDGGLEMVGGMRSITAKSPSAVDDQSADGDIPGQIESQIMNTDYTQMKGDATRIVHMEEEDEQ